jgi:DNA-binding MarR family transcriptional regulator
MNARLSYRNRTDLHAADTERLQQLSDEVTRIASTLARLSSQPVATTLEPNAEPPSVSAERIRWIIRTRRVRARHFGEELFSDPAWDMLLDLLHAELRQLRVSTSSLCIAAAVPSTTALRWIKKMERDGLLVRKPDSCDGRRVFVELTPQASLALRRYFAEIGKAEVI